MSLADYKTHFIMEGSYAVAVICYKNRINLTTLLWDANHEDSYKAAERLYENLCMSGESDKLLVPEIQVSMIGYLRYFFHPRDTKVLYQKLVDLLPYEKKPMTKETETKLDEIQNYGERFAKQWEGEEVERLVFALTNFVEQNPDSLKHAKRRLADIAGIVDAVERFVAEEKIFKASLTSNHEQNDACPIIQDKKRFCK